MLCPGGVFEPLCRRGFIDVWAIIGIIIQYMLDFAVVASLIYLIWGGIKWIIAAGDKKMIDSAKGTIIHSLVGLAITFASFYLLNTLGSMFGIDSLATLTLPGL